MDSISWTQVIGVLIAGLIIGGIIGLVLNSFGLLDTSNPVNMFGFIILEGFVMGFLFTILYRLSAADG